MKKYDADEAARLASIKHTTSRPYSHQARMAYKTTGL